MRESRLMPKFFAQASGLAVALSLCLSQAAVVSAQGGVALVQSAPSPSVMAATNEWLTWGYDQERTLWNRAETVLSRTTSVSSA